MLLVLYFVDSEEENLDVSRDAYYYLSVDLFIILLQAFSIVGNGFIVYLFCIKRRLRKNLSLRLVLTLAITDFLFGISSNALPCLLP
uniref:G-protein coupled receptors family 1 profile domain-containing protein n=1 Tax=Ditylenchus dipsaci TaxID=166011 RepID=A0A915DNS5_9BILA